MMIAKFFLFVQFWSYVSYRSPIECEFLHVSVAFAYDLLECTLQMLVASSGIEVLVIPASRKENNAGDQRSPG